MEDEIRDCESIDRLNELIDRGLNEELVGLAFARLYELTIGGETYTEDDSRAESSTTMDIRDEISSCDKFDRLNNIIEEDNWQTEISGLAFQRIVELSGWVNGMEDIVGDEQPSQSMVEDVVIDLKRPADETVDELRANMENFLQDDFIKDILHFPALPLIPAQFRI